MSFQLSLSFLQNSIIHVTLYSLFYHTILDVPFRLYKYVFCHDAVTHRNNCMALLLTINSLFASFVKYQNSFLILLPILAVCLQSFTAIGLSLSHNHLQVCSWTTGNPAFLFSVLITINNCILHGLFCAQLLTFFALLAFHCAK